MQTFKEIEYAAWTGKASAYDDWFAPITRQAIDPLLLALTADFSGKRFLDICCGTGHVVAAAAARGANAAGVDFAESMVAIARKNYPDLTLQQGDAERLAVPENWYDFAVNAFGLWHLRNPEAGLSEAFRVLKPGGRFAFATWLPPERGFDLFRIVMAAIQQHGTLEVPIPPAPAPFRFADAIECDNVLRAIGFTDVAASEHSCWWRARDGQQVLDLVYKSIVRAPIIIEHQDPDAKELIKTNIVERAEKFRKGDVIELHFPYLLVSAAKPN